MKTWLAFTLALIMTAGLGYSLVNPSKAPLVIAHRGASGLRPEHTLAAYTLAIEQGADFIEPDLVMTKDGVLVARHENEIGSTTDVATHPEFADRKRTRTIDGKPVTGWFTEDFTLAELKTARERNRATRAVESEDFTLAELKTLRARERLAALRPASKAFDGQFPIPTLPEIIALVQSKSKETGRTIGLYLETKHPTYFRSISLPIEEKLIAVLEQHGYSGKNAPIFIQSFEVGNLKALRKRTELPLIQLLDESGRPYDFTASGDTRTYADLAKPEGLAEIATYAQGIGAAKALILPRNGQGAWQSPTSLVADAHARGLKVHAWTFRNEDFFLPRECKGKPEAEVRRFLELGVDGVFSDFPETAVQVRNALN